MKTPVKISHAKLTAASLLAQALVDIYDVRKGLKRKHDGMRLELGAFEDQGSGGVGYGNMLVDVETGAQILDLAEKLIVARLAELGMRIEPERPR